MRALRKSVPPDAVSAIVVERVNALTQDELDGLGGWQPLADLSSRTLFDTIDADPASVVVDNKGRFETIASIYITLVYGPSRDEETLSDEYVATVEGEVHDQHVTIDTIRVDTSPFYE